MKKVLLLFAILTIVRLHGQSSVDYFCGTEHYLITATLEGKKYTVRVLSQNVGTFPIGDASAAIWNARARSSKDAAAIAGSPAGVFLSQPEIISYAAYNAVNQEVDVTYWDTLVETNLADIYNSTFAVKLLADVQARFPANCATLNFDAILQVLEAKFIRESSEKATSLVEVLEKSIGVGIGLGPNFRFKPQYDYYVSPYDSTLRQDRIGRTSFVASLLLMWNPLFTYRKFLPTDKKVATGPLFKAPGPVGFCLGLNFADVNPNDLDFNLKLSGGFGITVNLGNGFQTGVFIDLTREKVLRQEIQQLYLGKKYPYNINSEIDKRFFTTKTIPSISIKAIYRFKVDKSNTRPGIGQYIDEK